MANTTPQIAALRLDATGVRGAFEEFCCQVFRRAPGLPADSQYRRIRGDGGDGGVEALWRLPTGEIWGLQAKFFEALGAKQKAQLTESIRQAVSNYPSLARYTICLPFNLTGKTGAKAGKPKRGQHEKLSEWITDWQSELAATGRQVEIETWDESELIGRLGEADRTGGLARYWFDQEALTPSWFAERLAEAIAQAGPRYCPELSVATPLDDALQAFGCTKLWAEKIEQLAKEVADALDRWRATAGGTAAVGESLPSALMEEAQSVVEAAEPLEQSLGGAGEKPELLTLPVFRDAVRLSLARGSALEPRVKEALLAEHGEGADSPGFRQWRAENMADFPMAPLDRLRTLMAVLREVEGLAFQPEGQLPAAVGMLLRGEAGIGKTHGILDTAIRREAAGLLSLVVFGEDVTGSDPWQTVAAKLGLGNGLGRDALLDALNATGEATGFPLIIFIDALNETQPDRRKWQSWLPPMFEQIKRRPFLKLCISCREIYVHEVVPPGLHLPSIEHNGFLGREYEALFAFFQHYGLGVPAEPLFQEEFANPLFLRLVCEAVRDSKVQPIPAGRNGIRAIINMLLRAKNARAAVACDYDPRENRVSEAMLRVAGAMAAVQSRTLPLADVRSLVDGSPAAQSRSLFALLESESLVSTIERQGDGLGSEIAYFVRFTFERIGDHLIGEHLLGKVTDVSAAFTPGGPLHFLVVSSDTARANAGILEALSIQLPEAHGAELIDALDSVDRSLLWGPFIAGLRWRNPQFISDRTVQVVREGLGESSNVAPIFEVLLGFAAQPGHPLNARFLDRLLRRIPLLARDPFWADQLEESYSGWSDGVRPKSGVHRLIDTARRANLHGLPDAVGTLWATILAWFCASPDRRIRDTATMAMVSILRAHPGCIAPLMRRFLPSDDEYISERVLVTAYGALLLTEDAQALRDAAEIVWNSYFAEGPLPLNASLRDHARLIIELSVELGVTQREMDPAVFRPPYESPWPIALPSEDDVRTFADDRARYPEMNLVQQFGYATGTDFARYVVEPRITKAFDIERAGLDKLGIFRWFLSQAAEFGYPGPNDQCAIFDRILLGKFGGGRGKPGWAERLGKKYYWIFLRQIAGQLADHTDRKTWNATFPPSDELQSLDLRDIDPTDIRQFQPAPPGDHGWLTPAPYVFRGRDVPADDAAWLGKDDLPDIAQAIAIKDPDGALWQVVEMGCSWNGKRTTSRSGDSYRYVSQNVHAATCDPAHSRKVLKAFEQGSLDFNHEPHDYNGYLGEYPLRWPYVHRSEDPVTFDSEQGGVTFQYLSLRQLRGRDWERDYSQIGQSSTLLMPSPVLVEAGNLRWDRCGGWQDSNGRLQIQDPRWWSDASAALICRADYMDRFLETSNLALVIVGFQLKFIAGGMGQSGRVTERTLFIRHEGKTKLVRRNVERD